MNNDQTIQYLNSIRKTKSWKHRIASVMPIVSLLVVITVFWCLKLTGITLSNQAFCGMLEHEHVEECYDSETSELICGRKEHIHVLSCFSDIDADLETSADWEATLPKFNDSQTTLEKILAIAQSQLGYTESDLNFFVDENLGIHGYTRYGEWYGNPYGDWSAMFAAFCLRYAGVDDVPINSGAETMRIEWEKEDLYRLPSEYTPLAGNLVFLDTNFNGSADAIGILKQHTPYFITVYEGNYENSVAEVNYLIDNAAIMGYGISDNSSSLVVLDKPTGDSLQVGGVANSNTFNEILTSTVLMNAQAQTGTRVAITTTWNNNLATNKNSFVVYASEGSQYYAFDGNGNAVPITIANDGGIYADVKDPSILLWTFTRSNNNFLIKNKVTGKYMHAFSNNGSGVLTDGEWTSTLVNAGSLYRIRSNNNDYARLDTATGRFTHTNNASNAANFSFGITSECYVWLDGTNGGLMSLNGSPNVCYTVSSEQIIKLPSEWQSPQKYSYSLQGWYDVTNSVYYAPGAEVIIKGNMVLYADWVATTYDIGQFNAYVANTVSTNHIITTNVFDYGYLFNVMSQKATVNVSSSSHSESWSHVSSGTVPYKNETSIDFIFSDNDSSGKLSMASNRDNDNSYSATTPIKSGILTPELEEIIFGTHNSFDPSTGEGIIGKNYLGTGDHLFQYMTDPNSEYYGYYYYDATLNAASYNASEQRFYVYEYLARSSDSSGSSDTGKYSDFLPLNSPYANTNGQTLTTYKYNGVNGEYAGIDHYQYDARYNTDSSSANNVGANLGFGMSMEMKFYLPDVPGSILDDGKTGNRDLFGNEMIYRFSGDDDLWVLIDGEVILDMGGIHQAQEGEINFSTGEVTINGSRVHTINNLPAGDHTFTVYYLDRGASQSNCSMYFNIAPRFSLDIYKEDVLTQEALDGVEFTVYTDFACTTPALLWESKWAYDNNLPAQSAFRVENGVAKIWGLSPGKKYYIKETKPPNHEGYDISEGIICLTFDIKGIATFDILIEEEAEGEGISPGYTVHSYKVDYENQAAYMTVTNAQNWVKDITSVQAYKVWNDTLNHSDDYVTIYLSIRDPDGTIRRIREAIIGEENDWTYTWTNLPKFAADGTTLIDYIIEESYTQGYSSTIESVDEVVIGNYRWDEAVELQTGDIILLKTPNGYLSAQSSTSSGFKFISEAEAKAEYKTPNSLATWTVSAVSSSNIRLVNGCGQIITFNSSNRQFYLTTKSENTQSIKMSQTSTGFRLYCTVRSGIRNTNYYLTSSTNSSGQFTTSTSSGSGLILTPMLREGSEEVVKIKDIAYKITNTPLDRETSLTVYKEWDIGFAVNVYYENIQITVKLLANGKDTGRTLTLNLKNNWTGIFQGLPYEDENGDPIVYTIEEGSSHPDWEPIYGEIVTISGSTPTYETVLTNVYRYGHGYELPATGGIGQTPLILCGLILMTGSLVYGCVLICKRERRQKRRSS